jgi:heme/copper-type cytochrome/quinol oxidase subunit 2
MNTLIWLCATSAIIVFGVMLHSIATFRGGATRLRHHAITEVAWALVPILIVITAAVPSLRAAGESTVVTASTD